MPSSINTTAITWASASSKTVNVNAIQWSDAVTVNAEDWDASLQVTADNQGTPASGDTCAVYIAWSPDGSTFDSDEHGQYLGQLDTYPANTPGEDPARRTFELPVSGKAAFKLGVLCAQAATRNIVVTAKAVTHRPQ